MWAMRSRWAAIGAAVAVTIGGGGIALVSATSPSDAVTLVPITPCRVMDTRPAGHNVGPRSAPLTADETYTVDAVNATADAGNCAGLIPSNATAISVNMTTVDATVGTFLTVWEADKPRPLASSLNPAPGQPPTPNAVTTNLNSDGEFSIYNNLGTVHVLADINGYYTDHDHDDRYYTQSQVDAAIAAASGPWSVSVGSTDLVPNSNLVGLFSLGGPTGQTGMAFDPDGNGTVFLSFGLPEGYTAGTDVRLDVAMAAVTGFGVPVFPCDAVWRIGTLRVTRVGGSTIEPATAWDAPSTADDFTTVSWSQRLFDTRTIVGTPLTIDGDGLQPGDRVTGVLVRFGNDVADTCRGMMVVGLTARAAG